MRGIGDCPVTLDATNKKNNKQIFLAYICLGKRGERGRESVIKKIIAKNKSTIASSNIREVLTQDPGILDSRGCEVEILALSSL